MEDKENVPKGFNMSLVIDKCAEYIKTKDCFYLAKEGYIVYFSSDTGRKSDYAWKKLSIPETLRIIRATRLSSKEVLKDMHLIAAFQEVGRVYEYGTKTRHKVAEGIFNYSEHSRTTLADEIMAKLSGELLLRGFHAMLVGDATALFNNLSLRLGTGCGAAECRDLMFKHFETLGYVIKTGSARPRVGGKLTPTIMQPNTRPSEVLDITESMAVEITNKIYGELK